MDKRNGLPQAKTLIVRPRSEQCQISTNHSVFCGRMLSMRENTAANRRTSRTNWPRNAVIHELKPSEDSRRG